MSKSKRTSKAKRLRTIPRDPVTGQQFIFDPATGEPVRRYRHRKPSPEQIKAEKAARAARRQRQEERRAAFQARLARRPAEMQRDGYRLPDDVAVFLRRLHREPVFHWQADHVTADAARAMAEAAYMDGCRQGFIEGFLYGEDKARPGALKNRERLRQQNLEKLARLGIADRNAQIVAEFHQMERDLPGKEQRYEELAARHELTTRQIGTIIRKASMRRQ